MINREENNALRDKNGNIKINDKLTSFLYDLMRDHLPPGKVQELMQDAQEPDVSYTNGYLAQYAEYVAQKLK